MKKSFKGNTAHIDRFFSNTDTEEERDGSVKIVDTDGIKTSEPFISLFPVRKEVLNLIIGSMTDRGYDPSQPIIIWRERDVLIDGHTRLQSAKSVGIKNVPAVYASFEDENSVIEYMYQLQFHRRNIQDSELITLIKKELERYENGDDKGNKAEHLIQRLVGISLTKVKQTLLVLEKASEKQIAMITNDESSIRSIYESLKTVRESVKRKSEHKDGALDKKVTGDFLSKKDTASDKSGSVPEYIEPEDLEIEGSELELKPETWLKTENGYVKKNVPPPPEVYMDGLKVCVKSETGNKPLLIFYGNDDEQLINSVIGAVKIHFGMGL
jgi:ParB family chromosome partitioning protein